MERDMFLYSAILNDYEKDEWAQKNGRTNMGHS